MSTPVSLNGTSYSIPATGEGAWGTEVSNYLIAIASGLLSKAGGSFTLTADADFGANYGLKAVYYKSRGTVSTAGILRLANNESIGWRDQANSADLELKVNTSDVLEFGGNPLVTLALGTAEYVLKMNSGGTAYEWGQILNAGISASAGIDASKISAGVVSNTEFDYLNGVTSAIQTQLDALTTGAASSTDNALARFDSTTGKIIQNSVAILSDAGALSGLTQLDVDNLRLDGNTLSSTDTNGDINLTPDGTGKTATTRPFEVSGTSSYVKIPSLTTSQRDALSAAAGQVIFNSDNSKYEAYDGSAWSELGSSGASGINYIENHDFESTPDEGSPDGWTDQDTDFAITAESTNAIRGTVSGYLEANASASANDVIYYAFTLDRGDKNKLMRLSFDYEGDGNYTADDISVDIYDVTNATAITPSVTNIGAGPGRFEALFVTTDSTSYRLRFTLNTGSTALALAIDDVRVTPELTVTANPKLPWTAFTADWNSSYTHGTGGSESYFYARDGQDMLIKVIVDIGSGGSIGATLELTIPEGLTIDTSIHPIIGRGEAVGYAALYNTGTNCYGGIVIPQSSTTLRVQEIDGTNAFWDASNPVATGSGDNFGFFARIPIAEWAGSVVTTANSRVFYVSHDGSSSVNGINGALIPQTTPAGTSETLTLSLPYNVDSTTHPFIEIDQDGSGNWFPLGLYVEPLTYDGTNFVGAAVSYNGSNWTLVRGKYKQGGSTAWSGLSANARWRIVFSKLPLGIGTGLATATQAGAVESFDEGTFTPVLKEGANTLTTSSSTGTYTKIGKTVWINIYIVDITQSGTGDLSISGLPHTPNGIYLLNTSLERFNITAARDAYANTLASDQINIRTARDDGSANAAVTASMLSVSNNSDLLIQGFYQID